MRLVSNQKNRCLSPKNLKRENAYVAGRATATSFLFVFLPVVLMLFFLPGFQQWRAQILIVVSLVFCGVSGIEHAIVLCVDVAWV